MLEKNKPHFIEGTGWRYETEHSMKRWPHWKDAKLPGTYMLTLSVAGKQPLLGHIEGHAYNIWRWMAEHPEVCERARTAVLPAKTKVVGERRMPFVLPLMAKQEGRAGSTAGGTAGMGTAGGTEASTTHHRSMREAVPRIPVEAYEQEGAPHVVPSLLGEAVLRCWSKMHELYPQIELVQIQLMPNHMHAVLAVHSELPRKIGSIVGSFMMGGSAALRALMRGGEVQWSHEAVVRQIKHEDARIERLVTRYHMERQRSAAKRRTGREQTAEAPSLWDEGYCMGVIMDDESLERRLVYNMSNPFFAMLEEEETELFTHRQHLMIAGRDYAAYGCIFLLKEPGRVQVFCHRKARLGMLTEEERHKYDTGTPPSDTAGDSVTNVSYIETQAFNEQKDSLLALAADGTVIVTPGISPGEKDIMVSALMAGDMVIQIQKEPMLSAEWHPDEARRLCCSEGNLLILAPWVMPGKTYQSSHGEVIAADTRYSQFHNLNDLANEICETGDECCIRKT